MNISTSELTTLGTQLGVIGQGASAAAQSALASQLINSLWTVVVLQRSGDAQVDPFRTINSFSSKANAMAFALPLKFTDRTDAVMLYNGSTFDSVVMGDRNLVDLYCARAGVPHPAPTVAEVTLVAAQVVVAKPVAVVTKPAAATTKK